MKGLVFTEFLEMVEGAFSEEIADRIIEQSDLASHGAYTTLGTYDHGEMLELVTHLSHETGIAVPDLVFAFGKHLFNRFTVVFPQILGDADNTFAMLESIDRHIHIEVRKLYADAQLPRFVYERPTPDQLVMVYRSDRPFALLAHGLISQCAKHYGEDVDIHMEDLSDGAGTAARFTLTKHT